MNAICCIAKNEERYIKEWIDYHLYIGFDRIYIFDNNDDYNFGLYGVVAKPEYKDKVVVIDFKQYHEAPQFLAYNMMHDIHMKDNELEWVAFIDVDEFIQVAYNDIKAYLNIVPEEFGIVALNWMTFGTNMQFKYEDKPVQLRFTNPKMPLESEINKHVKSIIHRRCIDYDFNYTPHIPATNSKICNSTFTEIPNHHHSPDVCFANCYIRHYVTKSFEEWNDKINRGMADGTNYHRKFMEFTTAENFGVEYIDYIAP